MGDLLVAKNRRKCSMAGCNNIAMSKGYDSRGKLKLRKYCSTHHKLSNGRCPEGMQATSCSVCNWLGPCDRHRILFGMDGGRYRQGNVVILCPNCHRLVHLGELELK